MLSRQTSSLLVLLWLVLFLLERVWLLLNLDVHNQIPILKFVVVFGYRPAFALYRNGLALVFRWNGDFDRLFGGIQGLERFRAAGLGFLAGEHQVSMQIVAFAFVDMMLGLFNLENDIHILRIGKLDPCLFALGALLYGLGIHHKWIGGRSGRVDNVESNDIMKVPRYVTPASKDRSVENGVEDGKEHRHREPVSTDRSSVSRQNIVLEFKLMRGLACIELLQRNLYLLYIDRFWKIDSVARWKIVLCRECRLPIAGKAEKRFGKFVNVAVKGMKIRIHVGSRKTRPSTEWTGVALATIARPTKTRSPKA